MQKRFIHQKLLSILPLLPVALSLLLTGACRPDTKTDLLPELNFLISLHPDVTEGRVGYWPLDGNTLNYGTTGSAANGAFAGTPPYATPCADRRGNPGGAYCFNPSTINYIQIPYNAQLDFDTHQDFTISAWAQISPGSSSFVCGLITKGPTTPISYSLRYDGTLTPTIKASRADTVNSPTVTSNFGNPTDNIYRHYLFMKAGSQLYLYVNGMLQASTPDTTTASTLNPAGSTNIGFYTDTLAGAIDDVRIYNRALSDREIEIIYNY